MKQITAYQCDYCDNVFIHHSDCGNHEDVCVHNPSVRHCQTCYYDARNILCEVDKEEIEKGYFKQQRKHCKYWKPATASNSKEVKC